MSGAPHRPPVAPANDDDAPLRSLVLSGGGMRVGYQAGVVRALLESGLRFVHADGTSGGSINLGMLLSGQTGEEMCDRWSSLDVRRFVAPLPLVEYLAPHRLRALAGNAGVRRSVFPHLGVDVSRINAATGTVGTFNVCNYNDKTNEVFTHDAIDEDLLVAGLSLPLVMPPVRRNGTLYLDSAWIKDANLMEAVRRGAEEIWVVWAIGNVDAYRGGSFNQFVHMLELTANGGLFEELDRIAEVNERRARGEVVFGSARPVRLHVICPRVALPLDPELYFGRISSAMLVALGYADGWRYLRTAPPDGLPFDATVTKAELAPGLRFEERLTGSFTLGGEGSEGRPHGSAMKVHCAISFAAGGGHGRAVGAVEHRALGRLLARDGDVAVVGAGSSAARLRYGLVLRHGEEDVYLAISRPLAGGARAWRAVTTADVRLHRGTDESGEALGAGILHTRAADLMRLLWTLRGAEDGGPSATRGLARLFRSAR